MDLDDRRRTIRGGKTEKLLRNAWVECPLFGEYKIIKRDFFREMRRDRRRREEQQALWDLLNSIFTDVDEPKRDYWIRRLFRFYTKRFWQLTDFSWIAFLAEMSDLQATGTYSDNKAKRYCIMVRDAAIDYCKEHYKKAA